jgi:hypothetical protein
MTAEKKERRFIDGQFVTMMADFCYANVMSERKQIVTKARGVQVEFKRTWHKGLGKEQVQIHITIPPEGGAKPSHINVYLDKAAFKAEIEHFLEKLEERFVAEDGDVE